MMAMAPDGVGYSQLPAATGRLAVCSGPVSEGPSVGCGAAILGSEGSLLVLFLFLLLGRVPSVPYRELAFIFTGFGWVFLFGHRIVYVFTLSCFVTYWAGGRSGAHVHVREEFYSFLTPVSAIAAFSTPKKPPPSFRDMSLGYRVASGLSGLLPPFPLP
jgi:hypothetical protein